MQSNTKLHEEDKILKDEDIWIRKKLAEIIDKTNHNYKNYRFDYAAKNLYSFIWKDYCSWYIEIAKIKLNTKNTTENEKNSLVNNLREVLKNILLLLHPIMPFITEEIYNDVYDEKKFIQDNSYPESKNFLNDANVENIDWLIEVVSAIRKTRSEIGVLPNKEIEIIVTGENKKDKLFFTELSSYIKGLAKISTINFSNEDKEKNYYTCVSNNLKILIPASDLIDIDAEILRLNKEKDKYINQTIGIESRLSNSDFVNNAPGHIVVADEQKLKDLKIKINKIEEQLKNYS